MTPKAISIVSQLRREFYSLFAVAMPVQVSITPNNSSMGNLPTAYWIDDNKRLNYLRICVYTAPDDLIPERPFILRIYVETSKMLKTNILNIPVFLNISLT